jgi:hypothetical protein
MAGLLKDMLFLRTGGDFDVADCQPATGKGTREPTFNLKTTKGA